MQDIDAQENAGDVQNIPAGPSSQLDDDPLPARYRLGRETATKLDCFQRSARRGRVLELAKLLLRINKSTYKGQESMNSLLCNHHMHACDT